MKTSIDNILSSLGSLKESKTPRKQAKPAYIMEVLDVDPTEKFGLWLDPRVDSKVKGDILKSAKEMSKRCKHCNAYDSCVEWMSVLSGSGYDVDMYRGNGGHYWLSVNGVVFDTKARKVVGYPNLTTDSYEAEKIIWKGDTYVDNDILNEDPVD